MSNQSMNMEMQQVQEPATHSETPWRLGNDGRSIETFFEGEWVQIAAMNRTQWSIPHDLSKNSRLAGHQSANAELIVRAVNNHDALIEALTSIADQVERATLVQDRSVHIIKQVCALIAKDARAALASAKSE